jgi:ribosomal protein S18 acetylase RimI-like enzyme
MSEPTPVIREFHFEQDYEAALHLWARSGPGVHVGRSDEPQEIRKKVGRDPELFLVAEMGSKLVGTAIGGFDGRRGMVYHLAVDPDYRQVGIGSALMAVLEQRLRSLGCIRAYLMVVPGNTDAMSFYEAIGWQHLPVTTYAKDFEQLE